MDGNIPQGDQVPPTPAGDQTPKNDEVSKKIWDKIDELGITDEDFINSVKTLDYQRIHNREMAHDPKTGKKYKDLLTETAAVVPSVNTTPPVVTATTGEEVEKAARKVAFDLKKEEELSSLPEDKRAIVDEFFGSITKDKVIDAKNFSVYMSAAERAAGISPTINSSHRIATSATGAVPPRTPQGPTPEQVEFAKKVGNDPMKVYGKDVDFSHMMNAEKIVGKKEEEFN